VIVADMSFGAHETVSHPQHGAEEHRALPRYAITRDQTLLTSKYILDNLPADRQCCRDYLHASLSFKEIRNPHSSMYLLIACPREV